MRKASHKHNEEIAANSKHAFIKNKFYILNKLLPGDNYGRPAVPSNSWQHL